MHYRSQFTQMMMEGRGNLWKGAPTLKKNIDFVFAFFDSRIFTVESGNSFTFHCFFFPTVCNAASSIRAVVCCLSVHRHAACVLHKCAAVFFKHFPSLALTSK